MNAIRRAHVRSAGKCMPIVQEDDEPTLAHYEAVGDVFEAPSDFLWKHHIDANVEPG